MPHDQSAAAAVPPLALVALPAPEPEPKQEPTWTRKDDKLLQLMFYTRNDVSIHDASKVLRKTPAQMHQRCNFMLAEIRQVLEALEVETPREWDMEIAATTTAALAVEQEEAPEAAVVPAAPPVAAAENSAAPTTVVHRKKKPGVEWTEEEHRCFLAGLPEYQGNWQAMSREYLTNKTASQIASHYQKYRNREKQRERDECKRASIHDLTEPWSAAAVAVAAHEAAAVKYELPRAEASARGEEDEPREPVESGEPTSEDGFGPVEEFPGADDPGTLLTKESTKGIYGTHASPRELVWT